MRWGSNIADESQFGNRRFDPEACAFGDQIRVVEHVGHRANRDARTPSDVLNAGAALLCHVGRLYLELSMAEAVQP
jgi:hypothetical protein